MGKFQKESVLGSYLRMLRKNKNVKQEEVAGNIGVKRAAYSHYENGRIIPPTQILAKLSEYYEIKMETLIEMALKDKNCYEVDAIYGEMSIDEQELVYYYHLIPENYKKLIKTMAKECYKDSKAYHTP